MFYAMGIDAGKSTTKAVGKAMPDGQPRKLSFPTRMYNLNDGDVELEGNTYKVEHKELSCLIGEQGTVTDHDNTKTSRVHQMAIYTSICLLAGEDLSPQVVITVGCPTSIFKNKSLKEDYRKMVYADGQVSFRLNGKVYDITILQVLIRRESSGLVYIKPDLFRSKTVGILDLGGKNFNYSNYVGLVCKPTNQFSNNLGSEYLETRVQAALTEYLGEDIQVDLARKAIEEGGLSVQGEFDRETAAIVLREKESFAFSVIGRLKSANVNIMVQDFIATGGLFKNVIDQFKKHIPHIQVPDIDLQWCNAEGFGVVSEVKYRESIAEKH